MALAIGTKFISIFKKSHHDNPSDFASSTEKFKSFLSQYDNKSISIEQCMTECCKCALIAHDNSSHDLHLHNFREALQLVQFSPRDRELLAERFKHTLGEAIKQEWMDSLIQTFYKALSASEKNKTDEIYVWTKNFFECVDYFDKWEGNTTKRESDRIHAFVQKFMLSRQNEEVKIQSIKERAKNDPKSLSKEETEIFKNLDPNRKFVDIKDGMELINKSIWQNVSVIFASEPVE